MADRSKIEWTDTTVNFWEGCQKAGPGCDNCYAEDRDNRFHGGKHWGPGAPRRKTKGGVANIRRLQRQADKFEAENGRRRNVFVSSLSDIFDNAVPIEWTHEALTECEAADRLNIQLLTKRVGNVEKRMPASWHKNWPQHIGLLITVVNQEEADRDIPKLLDLKARFNIPWVGLSIEPMIGAIDLTLDGLMFLDCPEDCEHSTFDYAFGVWECRRCEDSGKTDDPGIDWVICGGESGPNARPMHPDWARSLRDQCAETGVPFFMKQMGGPRKPFPSIPDDLKISEWPV